MKPSLLACLVLLTVAALAPLLATSMPWLQASTSGDWGMPAFAALSQADLLGLALAALGWGWFARRGLRHAWLVISVVLIAASFVHEPTVIVAPGVATISAPSAHDPSARDFKSTRIKSWSTTDHVLGTDTSGRDLAARVLHGLRVSLAVALVTTLLATVAGIALGLLAAVSPRFVGRSLELLTDATLAFPAVFAVLAARAFLPPSVLSFVLIIAVFRIPVLARVTEVAARSLRDAEFVRAAEGLGQSPIRIALTTLLPHASGPALALAGFGVSGAILAEAGLGFLGAGLPTEFPSLGNVLEEVRDLALGDPMVVMVPGLVLFAVAFAAHASSETIRRFLQSEPEAAP